MDELMGRRVPYSAVAEQSVLGSMLIDSACIPVVMGKVKGAEFYIDENRQIFETIVYMLTHEGMSVREIDVVTVHDQMKVLGYCKDNTLQYLTELMDVTPTAANVLEYCAIVREQALLRSLGAAASEITEHVYGGSADAREALELAERKIYALRREDSLGGLVPVTQIIRDVFSHISEIAKKGGGIQGMTTGLADIDKRLMGLEKGDLVLIASRPGMGKTSMALNMAVSAAKASKKTVAIYSLEMSRQQLVMRLLSAESRIDNKLLAQGRLSPEEWNRLAEAAGSLSNLDLRIDDNPSMTVAELSAECRRLDNLGLVLVDYLQLMQSSGSGHNWSNESRTQAVSDISRMMKVTAKELGVPLVCLSQLSRANESRSDKRPMLSDLRESGAIEQDADAVIGLYREGYYNRESEDPNAAEAIILKNRRGETGTVFLRWLPEFTSYVNDERRRNEDEY